MTQILRSATIFALDADRPRALASRTEAHAEFDSAFLVSPIVRLACSLGRLSTSGATLALETALVVGEPMSLELANGQSIAGKIDWCADGETGLLFDEPIDVIGTLARNLANLPAERRRMPRVELQQTIALRHAGRVEHVRARNISQGGAGIETAVALMPGDSVQLTFDALRPIHGVVRWVHDGQAGISFDEELGWQTLMPWLRAVQQRAQAPARNPQHMMLGGEGMIPDKHAIRLNAPASVRDGGRWWNARVRGITAQLVELDTSAEVQQGTQLWVSLPRIGGGPAFVIETAHNRILCEFRLPLRPHELGMIGGTAPIG